jgi:hypothetical protein
MFKIVTPAAHHRLTTLVAVKTELQVTATGDDSFLTSLIDEASSAIEAWCSRVFAKERVRETFTRRTIADKIMCMRFPIAGNLEVHLDALQIPPTESEADENGFLFRLDEAGQQTTWPAGRYLIEYDAGFVLPGEAGRNLPPAIERAALILAKGMFLARSRDPAIRSEEIYEVYKASFTPIGSATRGLPQEVEGLLAPFREEIIV